MFMDGLRKRWGPCCVFELHRHGKCSVSEKAASCELRLKMWRVDLTWTPLGMQGVLKVTCKANLTFTNFKLSNSERNGASEDFYIDLDNLSYLSSDIFLYSLRETVDVWNTVLRQRGARQVLVLHKDHKLLNYFFHPKRSLFMQF